MLSASFGRRKCNSDPVGYARCGPGALDVAERRDALAGARRRTDRMTDVAPLCIGYGKDEAEPGQIFQEPASRIDLKFKRVSGRQIGQQGSIGGALLIETDPAIL